MDVLHGKVKLNIAGQESSREGIWIGEDSKVDFNSDLEGTVIIGETARSALRRGSRTL